MKKWYNKPVSDIFKKAPTSSNEVQVGSLTRGKVTEGPTIDLVNPLGREDRSLFKTDITDYRYAKSADDMLMMLSKIDPDVSAGVWNFLRLSDSGLQCTALGKDLAPDSKMQERLDEMLFRLSGMNNFKEWKIHYPINQTASLLMKYLIIRGGIALELVLNGNKTMHELVVIDPVKVQFKHVKSGVFKPVQINAAGKTIKLDIPTFFWGLLDPDADNPYETPPFLPVLQAILFNISVMQDLERIVKRVAFPRISIKIIESTLRKFAPLEAQTDDGKMSEWLRKQKSDIASSLRDLAPEDAAVFFDSLEIDVLETKTNASIDYRPLKDVIDQRIITGLKSLPTILGRQFGSSQTLSGVEALLYSKGIASLQDVVAQVLSRALTLAMRLEGNLGYAKVTYNVVNLKPANELEAFLTLKQARVLEQLSLGFITDAEAVSELTGEPTVPQGYVPKSGTGFYERPAGLDAGAVASTRNPNASEQAGGGRERT